MSYATQTDLTDRYDEAQLLPIADRDGDNVLDSAVIAKALADADAEIDSYIVKAYDLPLPSTPARLVTIACDIAFYRLHPARPPDDVRRRYEDAVAWLRDVAEGRAELDIAGEPPAAAGGTLSFSGPDRVFDRKGLEGF